MKKMNSLIFWVIFLLSNSSFGQNRENNDRLTLQQCIDLAIEKNLTLQQSKLNVQEREITLVQSKADLLPSVNAGANYGFNWGRGIDPTTNQFINQRIGYTGYSASTSVTLFSGFQKLNTIKRNVIDLEGSKKDLESSGNDIILNVVSLYLNVIFNKELVSNSESQLASTRQQLERTEILVESGSLPRADLLNLQSQLATNEVNLINAENSYNLSLLNLRQSLQVPASQPFDIEVPDIIVDQFDISSVNPEEIYEIALANQPDIQSADLGVQSAVIGEKISRGARYPRLSLNGSLGSNYSDRVDVEREIVDGTTDRDVPIGFVQGTNEVVLSTISVPNVVGTDRGYSVSEQFSDNFNQSLSLQLSIPIFNGLSVNSNIQRSKIQRQRSEIALKQAQQTLRQTIEQAYNDASSAAKNYEASQKQVEALEESFRMAREQLELKVINNVDYEIAENNLYRAKSDLVRSKFDYIFKLKILDFYQGKPITF